MSDSLVKERKPIAKLDLMLDPVADRQHWIFHMKVDFDGYKWSGTASIVFFNPSGLFSGKTDYLFEDSKYRSLTFDADIEGECIENAVHFELYVTTRSHREMFATIFCDGARDNETSYSGQYHIPCRAPDTCGCEGTKGVFELVKETS